MQRKANNQHCHFSTKPTASMSIAEPSLLSVGLSYWSCTPNPSMFSFTKSNNCVYRPVWWWKYAKNKWKHGGNPPFNRFCFPMSMFHPHLPTSPEAPTGLPWTTPPANTCRPQGLPWPPQRPSRTVCPWLRRVFFSLSPQRSHRSGPKNCGGTSSLWPLNGAYMGSLMNQWIWMDLDYSSNKKWSKQLSLGFFPVVKRHWAVIEVTASINLLDMIPANVHGSNRPPLLRSLLFYTDLYTRS